MEGREASRWGSGRVGQQGRTSEGPGLGREERAKTLSPFKAVGTQAPSPAQARRGGATGHCSGHKRSAPPRRAGPLPPPQVSVYPAGQTSSPAKRRLRELLRGWGGEGGRVLERLSGLAPDLHVPICELGGRRRGAGPGFRGDGHEERRGGRRQEEETQGQRRLRTQSRPRRDRPGRDRVADCQTPQ